MPCWDMGSNWKINVSGVIKSDSTDCISCCAALIVSYEMSDPIEFQKKMFPIVTAELLKAHQKLQHILSFLLHCAHCLLGNVRLYRPYFLENNISKFPNVTA